MADVCLENISKSYGATGVLHDINLSIENGEFVVFVGPSGCGKSTLLKLIAGLEEVSGGQLKIDGRDVTGLEPIERGIAMVFQSYALYPHLSVYENIAFPLRLQKLPKDKIEETVFAAAKTLNLTSHLQHKPSELSGGQRQRVAIGRAIVRNPKVFLFDEPLSNLDAALRGQMRVELAELHKTLKTTMIYVTHDQVEAMTMADRIVILNDGLVEQFGTPMDIYKNPETKFVAGFIGQPGTNFIPVDVHSSSDQVTVTTRCGEKLEIGCEPEDVAPEGTYELGIRPEFLEMSKSGKGIKVKVRLIEKLGSTTLVYGNIACGTSVVASFDGLTEINDDHVVLTFDPTRAHLFDSNGRALKNKM